MKKITIVTKAELDSFLALPVQERATYGVTFASYSVVSRMCPCCDGKLQERRNSHTGRYLYDLWCPNCQWGQYDVDGGMTLADQLEKSERTIRLAAIAIERQQALHASETTCWYEVKVLPFRGNDGLPDPYPQLAAAGALAASTWRGQIDQVGMTASSFLRNGCELLELAPIRCVHLIDGDLIPGSSDNLLGEVLRSKAVQQLEGLSVDLTSMSRPLADLMAAPTLPRLRHLAITGPNFTWGPTFDIDAICTLMTAPVTATLDCFHASRGEGFYFTTDWDNSYHKLTEGGIEVLRLVDEHPWLRSFMSSLPWPLGD